PVDAVVGDLHREDVLVGGAAGGVGVPAPVAHADARRRAGQVHDGREEGGTAVVDVVAAVAVAAETAGDPAVDAGAGRVVILGLGDGALRVAAFPEAAGGGVVDEIAGPPVGGFHLVGDEGDRPELGRDGVHAGVGGVLRGGEGRFRFVL